MAQDKFKALVHYLIEQSSGTSGDLGSIRLNKALWFADVLVYRKEGESITGEKYVKRKRGPVPQTILQTIEQLRDEGKIHFRKPEFEHDSWKYSSLVEPETGLLSESHLRWANAALEFVQGKTANDISELTHDEVWEAASEGEEIPLFTTLVSYCGEIRQETIEWAESVINEREAV